MKPNLEITKEDLKTLYAHTKGAYPNKTFAEWCDECKKSYMTYFNNKSIYNINKYTYSQFVNAQILAIAY